jgi:hypothetical protein
MLKEADYFFDTREEPGRSCLQALRQLILQFDKDVAEVWRYSMPFYIFRGKRFCYLWADKKTGWPYLGIVDGKLIEHPALVAEKRSRMKIMLMDPEVDLPVETINMILQSAISVLK